MAQRRVITPPPNPKPAAAHQATRSLTRNRHCAKLPRLQKVRHEEPWFLGSNLPGVECHSQPHAQHGAVLPRSARRPGWRTAQTQQPPPEGTACSSNCRAAYHAPSLDLPSMKFRWMYRTTPNSISAKTNTPSIVTGITISKTVPNPCRGIPMSSRQRAGSPRKEPRFPTVA